VIRRGSRGAAVARVVVLALGLAFVVAASSGCSVDLERMIDQSRYDAYEPSEFFADGTIMRSPPLGTVSRSAVLGPTELLEGTRGDAYVTELPVPATAELLARGRNRYDIFCGACHGVSGDGRTRVAAAMTLRPPPSLHEPRFREYPAGRLYRVIAEGYGLMRSYAADLPVHDRWAVVAYVQALQLSQAAALEELPDRVRQEASQWLQ
jgi:mono/diheme cytochrome c family protein